MALRTTRWQQQERVYQHKAYNDAQCDGIQDYILPATSTSSEARMPHALTVSVKEAWMWRLHDLKHRKMGTQSGVQLAEGRSGGSRWVEVRPSS